MEQLDVFDCSNVLIASYFADEIGDRGTWKENRFVSGRLCLYAA